MVKRVKSLFRALVTGNDLDYILEPVRVMSAGELTVAATAIESISGQIAESVRRMVELLYGSFPGPAIRELLGRISHQLGVYITIIQDLIQTIDNHLAQLPPPETEPTQTTYIVQPGDSLSRIAARFKVSLQQLIETNHITNPNLIHAGQVLIIPAPEVLPPPSPPSKLKRPGIWVANGHPGNTLDAMYRWLPGSVTCIYDHLGPNQIHRYKAEHPETDVIIRFMHPKNWQADPIRSARDFGREIISKWPNIRELDPYIYYGNEMNLHYENGDEDPGHQHLYETREFYQEYAAWVRIVAMEIKNQIPEMRLVCPPFAYGHKEDGAPDDNGAPKDGWAGFDYLQDTIKEYFDNTICGHYYWGDGRGRIAKRLYDPEEASWHAFRWRRTLNLFKRRYNIEAKIIIDEAGSFNAGHNEFTEDCLYYTMKCLTDPRVIALTFFLWLDPTGHPGNVPNSWAQNIIDIDSHIERMAEFPFAQIREAIGQYESGGDYTAKNPDPRYSASGKYQYTDETWNGYGGYAHAKDAPAAVQDERIMKDLRERWYRYEGDIEKVIAAHYFPDWADDKAKWNRPPVPDGIPLRVYVNGVMGKMK